MPEQCRHNRGSFFVVVFFLRKRVCGGSLSYRLREIVGIGIKTLATVVFYSCFAAEKAFSLLNASFGACQANTLESCNHATIQQTLVTFSMHV